ncbi:substrate-binding domain-containing protein [Roseivirga sp. BDSF3-8]|uniref:substrate-binding domain-containing protein n=1 Tax=Roseivirga sp. BDSF3-8 TaxID=3241598 RepID=UPI00353254C5
MTSIKIRLGGVPEHFNYPIHKAVKEGRFSEAGIDLEWVNCPGGTGQMNQALRDETCDACILLTEGIITDILRGNSSRIVSGYVKSPLIWGVHTGVKSSVREYDDIFDQTIAISRTGSGSHLMPTVDALMKGRQLQEEQFVIVNDIDGAIKSLNEGETDIFYWEKFTTKPYVDEGVLRRVGEFITPWPCFMIAATESIIAREPKALDKMLRVIHRSCEEFMQTPDAPVLISDEYGIAHKDAKYWFHVTEWATDSWVSNKMLLSVLFTLKEAGIVEGDAEGRDLVWVR